MCCTFFRQVPINQSKEKAPVNGLPCLNGLLPNHQQIVAAGKVDNSASTEETSASSGMCRCRCTCGGQYHCSSQSDPRYLFGFGQVFNIIFQ